MIKYLYRKDKDYSRFNIIRQFCKEIESDEDIYVLMPFSKNQFIKHFSKRKKIVNDFFISNYVTYVYDRQKITKKNPRAWFKYFQDWINFRYSHYLLSDTKAHFDHWEKLFGKFEGELLVFPVLADQSVYFPNPNNNQNDVVKVLFYGSFIPLHGIDKILETFALLEQENVKFEATVIGAGQMLPKMEKLFDELQLKNVTMNKAFIEEQEIAKAIREHDIVMGIFGESVKAKSVVPNKVYQALASKKCTITMQSEVLDEFFTEQDLFRCENSPEAMKEALKYLIRNPEKREEIAQQGYDTFCKLYADSKQKFIEFVKNVGRK